MGKQKTRRRRVERGRKGPKRAEIDGCGRDNDQIVQEKGNPGKVVYLQKLFLTHGKHKTFQGENVNMCQVLVTKR